MGNVKVRVNNDDENALTLDSNESGEISSTIYSLSNNYKFKVFPIPDGGEISIEANSYLKDKYISRQVIYCHLRIISNMIL